ncbi:MAG: phage portal protein [Bacteroidales bacterium]|nr:phage portal protein [Bacteroidales bacterium]
MKYAKMLNGYAPIFSQFGSDIYASDVVQQAINCIVRETKKLMPKHIRTADGKVVMVSGNIQNVLDNPNPLMTTSDFIEKIIWNLFFNYNSFVLPMWDNDKLVALYPLQPTFVDFLQDASSEYFVRMRFNNGYEGTVRYSDLIHIKFNYSVNEFMGGNESGQPDNAALLKSLDLNNTLLEGVAKALKSSFAINGVVKYNTLIDGQKTEAALQELTEALRRNESGFMPLDLKGEFIPFNRQIQMVDSTTLKFIDEKILRHFGVPLPILTGDYTKAQYEAFFQKTIEPLIVSLNQAFTKALFTNRESSGFGNSVVFYYNKLNFMTVGETIEFVKISASAGAIRIDEIRAAFGYPPCEDQEIGNMFVMSKNYGSVESVKNMDLNEVGGAQNEDPESDT